MTAECHTLRTERIGLAPVREDDAPALQALFWTPYVRRYLFDDSLVDLGSVRDTIAGSEVMFGTRGLGLWALSLKTELGLAGFCGFILEANEPRLIYGLSECHSGRGLAREAAAAVVALAFHRGLNPVRASVDAENTASRTLLEALEFHISQTSQGRLGEVLVYERRMTISSATLRGA